MKRLFFNIILLSSLISLGQTTIVEEKYENKNEPITFEYLHKSNRFIVYKGFGIPMTLSYITTNALSFDVDGKKAILFENEKLVSPTFSVTEKSYKAYDAEKFSMKPNYKFFFGDHTQIISNDVLKDLNSNLFGRYDFNNVLCSVTGRAPNEPFNASFNDKYDFGFTNQKLKSKIDFEKDDIYLESIEIKTNIRKRTKLDKPDLTLLKGDSFAKDGLDTTFFGKLNGNENFDIITKSVSADFQTTILYKTTYDFEGKKINELTLNLKLTNKYFIASDNNGGPKEFSSTPNSSVTYLGTLSINHYLEDKSNGDIYVYGLFGDKAPRKIDGNCSPKGFYVFKFDKNGKKLWESVNYIDGKDYFERIKESTYLQVNLLEYKKELVFSVSVNSFTEFSYATVIDKSIGSISKINFIEYNNNTSKAKSKAFINNTYVSKDFKNKVFSQITFVAIISNSDVLKYLKDFPKDGNRLYYETVFSNQGIWLIETDNKEYYKVLLFK